MQNPMLHLSDGSNITLLLLLLNSMRDCKTHCHPSRDGNDLFAKKSNSSNGITSRLYSRDMGFCNPSYKISSLVRLQNNLVELNLTRDES